MLHGSTQGSSSNNTIKGNFVTIDQSSFKKQKEELEQRPPCPECGSTPRSHGESWKCTNCGRDFVKVRRK